MGRCGAHLFVAAFVRSVPVEAALRRHGLLPLCTSLGSGRARNLPGLALQRGLEHRVVPLEVRRGGTGISGEVGKTRVNGVLFVVRLNCGPFAVQESCQLLPSEFVMARCGATVAHLLNEQLNQSISSALIELAPGGSQKLRAGNHFNE